MTRWRSILFFIVALMGQISFGMATKIEKFQESDFVGPIRQLTFAGARSGEGYYRRDGKHIVFQSERDADNPFYQIYLMNLRDGSSRRISPGIGKTTCAWIHPNQDKVIFASTHLDPRAHQKQKEELEIRASGKKRPYSWDYDENYDLFVSDFGGQNTKRLTSTKGYDAEASFSPDGGWIVFASNRSGYLEKLSEEDSKKFASDPSYEMDLYLMRSDGTDLKRLTTTKGYDGGPFFNADGTKITWRRFSPDGRSSEIFTMNFDGSNVQQLTQFGQVSWAPFYHPSGDYLIFSANLSGGHNFELFLVRADGQGSVVQVSEHEGFDGLAVFSPDGGELAWTSGRGFQGKPQIVRAKWNDQAARKALGLPKEGMSLPYIQSQAGIDRLGFEAHVRYLSSQKLAGRLTGSEGERLAAEYIERIFKSLGLEPLRGSKSFRHPFEFTQKVEMGRESGLKLQFANQERVLEIEKDWIPLAFSATGEISAAEGVFAGYGLRVPALGGFAGYDSYRDLNVKGKWVVVFRYFPDGTDAIQKQQISRYSTLRDKAMLARDLGAKGLVLVSGPNSKVKRQLIDFSSDEISGSMSFPVISVSDEVASQLLSHSQRDLKLYQEELDSGKSVSSIEMGKIEWEGKIVLSKVKAEGFNVLARLPGLSREAVVIGAHYDHLGRGHRMNSLAKTDEQGLIHLGADDNASGVAGVLEIADELASQYSKGKRAPRDVIFALWSGEELGTLGSSQFVSEFVSNKKIKIQSYLNMDMIGRSNGQLIIQGIGSSAAWESIIEKAVPPSSLSVVLQADPYLPTDSTALYLAKVPVVNFFTGAHEDYHTPRDQADKISYDQSTEIVGIVHRVAAELMTRKSSMPYSEVTAKPGTSSRKLRIYLGTIPNYADGSGDGLLLSGVQKGGPGEKAGLQPGDRVVEMAGHRVENIYDYTNALDRLEIGKESPILIKRKNRVVNLKIVPESRD
ncbi:MAG: M20/M25/M40 family metallo-hydrolase [Bdellovibrionales bacterium]|nr:M20/M25/M40 family metallo-hydrolase [Bdellovibrionales bacterium]